MQIIRDFREFAPKYIHQGITPTRADEKYRAFAENYLLSKLRITETG
jgi:hypothetical protein